MQLHEQREYLLLLHHARKCSHGDGDEDAGPCPVTPHCAATKRLWRHITRCTHKECPHCYSARQLLTHYRDCKDGKCRICGPVREVVRRGREEKKLEQQRQRMQGQMQISRTDTNSTSTTTAGRSKTTIDEWVSLRRDNLMTIDGAAGDRRPSPTSESSPARPPIIPVRRRPSFGTMSSLSHYSSSLHSSTRSSVPSSRSGGSRSSGVYCSECIRLGGVQAQRLCSSGIRCRTNLGIAHFCTEEGSRASPPAWRRGRSSASAGSAAAEAPPRRAPDAAGGRRPLRRPWRLARASAPPSVPEDRPPLAVVREGDGALDASPVSTTFSLLQIKT